MVEKQVGAVLCVITTIIIIIVVASSPSNGGDDDSLTVDVVPWDPKDSSACPLRLTILLDDSALVSEEAFTKSLLVIREVLEHRPWFYSDNTGVALFTYGESPIQRFTWTDVDSAVAALGNIKRRGEGYVERPTAGLQAVEEQLRLARDDTDVVSVVITVTGFEVNRMSSDPLKQSELTLSLDATSPWSGAHHLPAGVAMLSVGVGRTYADLLHRLADGNASNVFLLKNDLESQLLDGVPYIVRGLTRELAFRCNDRSSVPSVEPGLSTKDLYSPFIAASPWVPQTTSCGFRLSVLIDHHAFDFATTTTSSVSITRPVLDFVESLLDDPTFYASNTGVSLYTYGVFGIQHFPWTPRTSAKTAVDALRERVDDHPNSGPILTGPAMRTVSDDLRQATYGTTNEVPVILLVTGGDPGVPRTAALKDVQQNIITFAVGYGRANPTEMLEVARQDASKAFIASEALGLADMVPYLARAIGEGLRPKCGAVIPSGNPGLSAGNPYSPLKASPAPLSTPVPDDDDAGGGGGGSPPSEDEGDIATTVLFVSLVPGVIILLVAAYLVLRKRLRVGKHRLSISDSASDTDSDATKEPMSTTMPFLSVPSPSSAPIPRGSDSHPQKKAGSALEYVEDEEMKTKPAAVTVSTAVGVPAASNNPLTSFAAPVLQDSDIFEDDPAGPPPPPLAQAASVTLRPVGGRATPDVPMRSGPPRSPPREDLVPPPPTMGPPGGAPTPAPGDGGRPQPTSVSPVYHPSALSRWMNRTNDDDDDVL